MEKLKCSSCGGEITVDNDKEYGTCPYCGTKYKLNQDVNVNIKLDDNMKEVLNNGLETTKHFSKFMVIPVIAFFVIFVIVLVSMFKTAGSFEQRASDSHSEFEQKVEKQKDDVEKSLFNFQFINDNGTKSAFFLESTFDEIVQSNKTHDRKVSLVFDGKEITDESEIINIKHSLSGDYEVSFSYDDGGYINKVVVDKIN